MRLPARVMVTSSAADALAALLAREPRPEEDPIVALPSVDALSAERT